MPWAKLTDDVYLHPKIVTAGNAATGLWVRCLSWSSAHLTDGVIPAAVAESFVGPTDPPDVLERVERSGLMTRSGGDYLIPDFLDFNPSSAEIEARRADADRRRERQREGGRKGAERRWGTERVRGRVDGDLRPAGGAVGDVVDGLRPRGAR